MENLTNSSARTHRFGANYVPSRNWWFCWNDYEEAALAKDLDSIASLGLDHVRIMLLWPFFQPNPTWVSPAHLTRLDRLVTLAEERGLDVCVTALNGWLSGFKFPPPFCPGESIYNHAPLIAAQEIFFRELSGVLNSHHNFLGFDLGNEINCYCSAETPVGDAWMTRMLDYVSKLSPGRYHVNGVDHGPWFHSTTFSPKALTSLQQIVPIHCWTFFTGALERGGPLGDASIKLLARMAALVRAHAGDASKPIWVQEYGASLEWMDEATISKYIEQTTLAAIDEGVSWFTWWCSHDIDPAFEFASLEYGLGLFTTDNRAKSYAPVFRELANTYRGKPVVPSKPLLTPPTEATNDATWAWLTASCEA